MQNQKHVLCENVFIVCRICQSCNLRGANECEVMTAEVQQLTCSGDEKLVYNQFHRSRQNYPCLVFLTHLKGSA